MPEVLGDGGVYFDPENVGDMAGAIRLLVDDASLRCRLAARAYDLSWIYSWEGCARATFRFLEEVAAAGPVS